MCFSGWIHFRLHKKHCTLLEKHGNAFIHLYIYVYIYLKYLGYAVKYIMNCLACFWWTWDKSNHWDSDFKQNISERSTQSISKPCISPPKAYLRVIQVTAYAKEISFTFSLTVRDLEITSKKLTFFFPFISARYTPICIRK